MKFDDIPVSPPGMYTVPAGHGKAARVTAGQKVKIINTHGAQALDFWVLCVEDIGEYLDVIATRAQNLRLNPQVGDVLWSNRRRPIARFLEDTPGRVHDTLVAACNAQRYELLGCEGYHRNCQDNMLEGLAEIGVETATRISGSWNFYINIQLGEDGLTMTLEEPIGEPGDYVVVELLLDSFIAFSSCPQDVLGISRDNIVREFCFELLEES